jgi:hypothetical protein
MRIRIVEIGIPSKGTFRGYHDREGCEDCLTRASAPTRVYGKRDDTCGAEESKGIKIRIKRNETS